MCARMHSGEQNMTLVMGNCTASRYCMKKKQKTIQVVTLHG